MKPITIARSISMLLLLLISLSALPTYTGYPNAAAAGFQISQTVTLTSADINNSRSTEEEERPLFESILLYLIIFIPVIVVTLLAWIFSRIIKLTKEKNEA
ncbi:hypothetical protein [Bacillus sp. P14.5]|uniref:hypothetical protein n=1 Tax=Bacillus sp. P14.5 TaxID=1983400 RepID=UPI0013B069DE|nr:hypothetical protein [Bacillus sp. P14.5]